MTVALVLLASYLLGSIPFSYLVARTRGVDVRTVGSGNVGATNVMRSAGKAAGIAAFVLDAAKGALAALLARKVAPGLAVPPLAAVAAIVGHMYPVWLGFRGGKGVATGAGAFLPLAPLATVAGLVAFALTRPSRATCRSGRWRGRSCWPRRPRPSARPGRCGWPPPPWRR